MTVKFNTVLEVVKIHVCAKFHQLRAAVHELSCKERNREKKLCDDAENNSAFASAGSNEFVINRRKHLRRRPRTFSCQPVLTAEPPGSWSDAITNNNNNIDMRETRVILHKYDVITDAWRPISPLSLRVSV